jgi:hypothetical protein
MGHGAHGMYRGEEECSQCFGGESREIDDLKNWHKREDNIKSGLKEVG